MPFVSKEADLLVCCIRNYLHPLDSENIRQLLEKGIDWDVFYYLAFSHRVIPQVYKSLTTRPSSEIPEEINNTLAAYCKKIEEHHTVHINELKKVLQLFKQKNIPVIPLKGPVLGKLYNNDFDRQWGDLDMIVHKQDINRIEKLFTENGYSNVSLSKSQLTKLFNTDHSINFYRKDGMVEFDIHWSLSNAEEAIDVDMKNIWQRCINASFLGGGSLMLCSENMILSTFIHHCARNCCTRLRFILDIALLFQSYKHADWNEIVLEADKLKIKRSLLVGASMAHLLFDVSLPAKIQQELQADKQVSRLQTKIYYRFFCNQDNTVDRWLAKLWNRIALRESLGIRMRLYVYFIILAGRYLLRPNILDKEIIRLPAALNFLYYGIRPFRLLLKLLKHRDKKKLSKKSFA